jgi:hypothetical protein
MLAPESDLEPIHIYIDEMKDDETYEMMIIDELIEVGR